MPISLPFSNFIQGFFHAGGETVVHQVGEIFHQTVGNDVAHFFGIKTAVILTHVAAILDRGNDSCVSGRAANAAFFQFLDQARLGKTGWRLGEMLVGIHVINRQHIAFFHIRQQGVFLALARSRRLNSGPTIELHDPPFRFQLVTVAGGRQGGAQVFRRGHLAGDKLSTNQLVQALGVTLHIFQGIRGTPHIRRTNGFVRFLGPFLAAVGQRRIRQVLVTQFFTNPLPAGRHGV